MSGTKAALRAAKAALDANRYQDAVDHAKTVLKTDPNSYHAYTLTQIRPCVIGIETDSAASSHVFLGRAFEKLSHNEESQEAYKVAISIKDNDALAWQGLVGLYEKQAGKRLDDYHDAAIRLAESHMEEYVELQIWDIQ